MLVAVPADLALFARARRAALKLGQADVARAAGVGRQWIVEFEAGRGSVELALALRTLAVLGIELRAAFGRDAPAWTLPLTRAAGTRARPYNRHRMPKRRLRLTPQPEGEPAA